MLSYLTLGLVLGMTAGLSPGPMMTLVITQSLRFGTREGLKMAVAPLMSDLPIVAISWFALSRFAQIDHLLGVVSLIGAGLLILIAIESWRADPAMAGDENAAPRSLLKGAIANLLNPHPWLFWLTIGSPTLIRAGTGTGAIGFLVAFYGCLVGSKVAVATIVGRYRRNLNASTCRLILRGLALALVVIACRLIWSWGTKLASS